MIQTFDENGDWVESRYKNWDEIIKTGFIFVAQTKEGVLMRFDGYLNEFKEVF